MLWPPQGCHLSYHIHVRSFVIRASAWAENLEVFRAHVMHGDANKCRLLTLLSLTIIFFLIVQFCHFWWLSVPSCGLPLGIRYTSCTRRWSGAIWNTCIIAWKYTRPCKCAYRCRHDLISTRDIARGTRVIVPTFFSTLYFFTPSSKEKNLITCYFLYNVTGLQGIYLVRLRDFVKAFPANGMNILYIESNYLMLIKTWPLTCAFSRMV